VVLTKPLVSRLAILFSSGWCHAPQSADNLLDVRHGDLGCREPHDRPSRQPCVEIFLAVVGETGGTIVTATAEDVQTALDFDQRPAFDMGEVGTPPALRIKSKLRHQGWPAETAPVEGEFCFKTGRI